MARVSLATAMARKPAVLLADEPTAGLEPELALVVMRLLQAVAAQGAAVVATTHDLQALATLTNSAPQTGAAGQQPLLPGGSATILLRQGKMVEATPTEQFCAGRAHTPYGQAFVMASPMHGANPLPPEFDDDLTVTSDTPINTGWSVPAGGQGEKTRS